MIDLIVKTLDSQNHAFTVSDDTTVRQLKDQIAESINFPVESQRLIYCGRVLQDEKMLSEYDVNGKVIHLVQRPPPQPARNSGSNRTGTPPQGRRVGHYRQSRLDGNAMYLGAMAFPADLVDAQGPSTSASPGMTHSRLVLARRMLRRAMFAINRLENPSSEEGIDQDTPSDDTQRSSRNAADGPGPSAESTSDSGAGSSADSAGNARRVLPPLPGFQQIPFTGSVMQAAQVVSQAIAAAVSVSQSAGVPNITIVESGQPGQNVDTQMEDNEVPETSHAGNVSNTARLSGQESPTSHPTEFSAASSSASPTALPNDQADNQREEVPRTSLLADILDTLNRVNLRLQPFLSQYHSLMREDPTYQSNTALRDSQNIFNGVSEVMHYLSHAYHIISDVTCDLSQPTPRVLRCRPVVIQHSAVLQAGIPIQIGTTQSGAAASASPVSNAQSADAAAAAEGAGASGAAAAATGAFPASAFTGGIGASASPARAATAAGAAAEPVASRSDSSLSDSSQQNQTNESSFNIPPTGNLEFFMEVGPGSITIDSLEATVVTNAGSIGGDGIQANVVGGSYPWGTAPPPEFFQNLMHAVAGHMMGRGGTTPGTTTSNQSASSPNTGATSSGQNSQARGNTATHPTTATQTRSTSRPHVHLAPAGMQSFGNNFDPFLPCDSHHIRQRTRSNPQGLNQGLGSGTNTHATGAGDAGVRSANESDVPSPDVHSSPSGFNSFVLTRGSGQATNFHTPSEATVYIPSFDRSAQSATSPSTATRTVLNWSDLERSNLFGLNDQAQTGGEDEPEEQQQQQQQQQQQEQRQGEDHEGRPQPGMGLLTMISNLLNNIPAGGSGQSVNFPLLVQPVVDPAQAAYLASNLRAGGASTGLSNFTWPPFSPTAAGEEDQRSREQTREEHAQQQPAQPQQQSTQLQQQEAPQQPIHQARERQFQDSIDRHSSEQLQRRLQQRLLQPQPMQQAQPPLSRPVSTAQSSTFSRPTLVPGLRLHPQPGPRILPSGHGSPPQQGSRTEMPPKTRTLYLGTTAPLPPDFRSQPRVGCRGQPLVGSRGQPHVGSRGQPHVGSRGPIQPGFRGLPLLGSRGQPLLGSRSHSHLGSRGYSHLGSRAHLQPGSVTQPQRVSGANLQPESEAQQQSESRAQPHSESRAQPHSESRAQPQSESRAQPQSESRAQPQSESRAQPQSESRAQPQSESRAQPQSESRAQPQSESRAQPQSESRAQPQPGSRAQLRPGSRVYSASKSLPLPPLNRNYLLPETRARRQLLNEPRRVSPSRRAYRGGLWLRLPDPPTSGRTLNQNSAQHSTEPDPHAIRKQFLSQFPQTGSKSSPGPPSFEQIPFRTPRPLPLDSSVSWRALIEEFLRICTARESSLLMGFVAALGENMTVVNLYRMIFGLYGALNDSHRHLRKFLLEVAYEGQSVTKTRTRQVVDRIIEEIRPYFQALQCDVSLRDDIDLATTMVCFTQAELPKVLSVLLKEPNCDFSWQIMRWVRTYMREVCAILQHCCINPEEGLDHIVYFIVMKMSLHSPLKEWTFKKLRDHFVDFLNQQDVRFDEIRPLLVYRVPPAPSTSMSAPSQTSKTAGSQPMEEEVIILEDIADVSTEGQVHEDDSNIAIVHESLKNRPNKIRGGGAGSCDPQEEDVANKENNVQTVQSPAQRRALSLDSNNLPSVVLGSEAWHNVLPSDWVPIVTRDSQSHRKQSAQPALSDAYLTGMPSKRRKVVSSSKPVGAPITDVISEGVRSALDDAAIRPAAGVEAAGEDMELQAAYREQVRSSVQRNVANHPDFTPDRFPQARNYFK